MSGLKKVVIGFVGICLVLSFQALIVSLAVVPTITDREAVKDIADSEAGYDAFTATVKSINVNQFEPTTDISDADRAQFNADKTSLLGRIDSLVPYEKYKQMTSQSTDGMYDWFEGKTQKPQFEIVLAKDRNDTVKLLEPVFIERYNALPECPAGYQILADFSPLSTECRPSGVSDQDVVKYLQESAIDPDFDDLFSDITISSDSIEISPDQTQFVQRSYAILKYIPYILMFSILVFGLIIGLVLRNLASILKTFGITSIIAGLPIFLSSLFMHFFQQLSIGSLFGLVTGYTALAGFINSVLAIVVDRCLIYSGVLSVIGIILLIVSKVIKQRNQQPLQLASDQEVLLSNQNINTPV